MVSKAIASVGEWLARAEEVLREQHEEALSPSSSGAWEGVKHEWTVSVGSFELGLEALLERLCCRPGRWILIAEDACRSYRFWQALAFEDGSLVVEAASGIGCPDSERLSPEAEGLLVEFGWDAPDPPSSPNWRRIEATTSPDISDVAAQAVRTLHEAFGLAGKDQVLLTLFASPRRGDTPASECLPGDQGSLEKAATRRGFQPTTEEWADYYRQLFPNYLNPRNSFEVWKYATTATNTAAGFWDARLQALSIWESQHSSEPRDWPSSHPTAVLRHEGIERAACLGCTWIADGEDEDEDEDGLQTAAQRHSLDIGHANQAISEPSPPVSPGLLEGVDLPGADDQLADGSGELGDLDHVRGGPLPPVGTRVEVMMVGSKPGPSSKYGVGVVSGIEWDSLFRTWRVVVKYDEPAGTYYGSPIRGSSTFPGNVHVVGADERPFSSMTPKEIEDLHEVRRLEFWRNIDPATDWGAGGLSPRNVSDVLRSSEHHMEEQ